MKKILPTIVVLLMVLVLAVGCVNLDAVELLKYKLENVVTAKTVTLTKKVLAGADTSLQENTLYEETNVYTVSGTNVTLNSTKKELNDKFPNGDMHIITESPADLTFDEYKEKLPYKINLTMDDLEENGYQSTVNGTTVTHKMSVKNGHVPAFLGLNEEDAQTITALRITADERDNLVRVLTLSYKTVKGNNVTITYSFTY